MIRSPDPVSVTGSSISSAQNDASRRGAGGAKEYMPTTGLFVAFSAPMSNPLPGPALSKPGSQARAGITLGTRLLGQGSWTAGFPAERDRGIRRAFAF